MGLLSLWMTCARVPLRVECVVEKINEKIHRAKQSATVVFEQVTSASRLRKGIPAIAKREIKELYIVTRVVKERLNNIQMRLDGTKNLEELDSVRDELAAKLSDIK